MTFNSGCLEVFAAAVHLLRLAGFLESCSQKSECKPQAWPLLDSLADLNLIFLHKRIGLWKLVSLASILPASATVK